MLLRLFQQNAEGKKCGDCLKASTFLSTSHHWETTSETESQSHNLACEKHPGMWQYLKAIVFYVFSNKIILLSKIILYFICQSKNMIPHRPMIMKHQYSLCAFGSELTFHIPIIKK